MQRQCKVLRKQIAKLRHFREIAQKEVENL
nr:MAG TPA: hypothetical protein [Caudoviricetes sp.]